MGTVTCASQRGRQRAMLGGWSRATGCPTHYFSLVVVHNRADNTWLAVEENKNRGWWLPGGFVENGDDHVSTAHKETLEEAGIKIKLLGVLHVQSSISQRGARQRAIFYAVPLDEHQKPKSVPDEESLGARWMTVQELEGLQQLPPPQGLR